MFFSTDLINAVLNYLSERPHKEVSGLIAEIMNQAANQPEADKEAE